MTTASSLSHPVAGFPIIPDCLNVVLHMAGHTQFALVSKSASVFWRTDKCQQVHNLLFRNILFQKIALQTHLAPSYLLQQVTCNRLRTREIDPVYLIDLHQKLRDQRNNGSCLNSILPVIQGLEHKRDWISSYLVAHILSLSRLGSLLFAKDLYGDKYIIHASLSYSSWLILLQKPSIAESIIHLFLSSRYISYLDGNGKKFCASAILGVYQRAINDLTKQDCLAILTELSAGNCALEQEINEILNQLSPGVQIESQSLHLLCPLEFTDQAPPETPDPLRAIHKKSQSSKPSCCTLS